MKSLLLLTVACIAFAVVPTPTVADHSVRLPGWIGKESPPVDLVFPSWMKIRRGDTSTVRLKGWLLPSTPNLVAPEDPLTIYMDGFPIVEVPAGGFVPRGRSGRKFQWRSAGMRIRLKFKGNRISLKVKMRGISRFVPAWAEFEFTFGGFAAAWPFRWRER